MAPLKRVAVPPHAPLLWRLGMTKGAFLAVIGLTVAIGVGFWLLTNIASTANHAARDAKSVAAQTQGLALDNSRSIIATRRLALATRRLALQSLQAKRALCAVQESTRQQIRDAVKFLTEIRTGKRPAIQGISEADILTGIARQQKFLKALDNLNC